MANQITLGDSCPPAGYYVLYSETTGYGPIESMAEAIEHLRRFACTDHAAPEFMYYHICRSDGRILDLVRIDDQVITGAYARQHLPYPPDVQPRPPRPEIPLSELPLTLTLSRNDWVTIAHALTFCIGNVDESLLEDFDRHEIEASEHGVNEDDGLTDAKRDEILDQRMEDLEHDLTRLRNFFRETL